MPVGRKRVPGIHQRQVAVHQPGFAALEWDNVELAVRPHQQAVLVLYKNDPLPIGGDLRKVVAHAVCGSALYRDSLSAATVVEWNLVKVVLDLRLPRVIGILRFWSAWRIWIARHRATEDQMLPVGRPERTGLHKLGI